MRSFTFGTSNERVEPFAADGVRNQLGRHSPSLAFDTGFARRRRCDILPRDMVKALPQTIPDSGLVETNTYDMVYRLPEAELHDLRERIESREGLHQLAYMKTLGMGNHRYQLVTI